MCLICGDLPKTSIPHLMAEINSLSDENIDSFISYLRKLRADEKFHQNDPSRYLRSVLMALIGAKARRAGKFVSDITDVV